MIELEAQGEVRVLHLRDGENRFNRVTVDAINAALDEVAAVQGPVALVTGRRFSGPEAQARGIVTELAAEELLLERAVELAAAHAGKDRRVIAEHKRLLHGDAIAP